MDTRRSLLGFTLLALTAACGTAADPPSTPTAASNLIEEVRSAKPYDTTPAVTNDAQAAAVAGHNDFGFALYRELVKSSSGNVLFSPTSIEYAFAMTYAGARGNTAAEMASTLHYSADTPAAYDKLMLALRSRALAASAPEAPSLSLELVNQNFAQKGYAFLPEFLDVLSTSYDAGMKLLDFGADPEGSRLLINGFVFDSTHTRIKDLLPPNSINGYTKLVLTNCVYFLGSWQTPFEPSATMDAVFHAPSSDVSVPTMSRRATLGYAEGTDWQMTSLPYTGGKLSMVIVLPATGKLDAVRSSLNDAWLGAAVSSMDAAPTDIALMLPRFSYEFGTVELTRSLQTLGIHDAFVGNVADFSGMNNDGLFISAVYHKAFIKVAERSTEAAAATAVVMADSAVAVINPVQPKPFVVDRPFIYFIRDETGLVLFVGEVTTPTG